MLPVLWWAELITHLLHLLISLDYMFVKTVFAVSPCAWWFGNSASLLRFQFKLCGLVHANLYLSESLLGPLQGTCLITACLCQPADHHPPNSYDFVAEESHGVIQLLQNLKYRFNNANA